MVGSRPSVRYLRSPTSWRRALRVMTVGSRTGESCLSLVTRGWADLVEEEISWARPTTLLMWLKS